MLNNIDFKQIVRNAPLLAIDLVVLDDQNQILLRQRINATAKVYWFVPSGRAFKNESLEKAFFRISKAELGLPSERSLAVLLGIYDHFYSDSVFDENTNTHFINAAYLIKMKMGQALNLPRAQHHDFRWLSLNDIKRDNTVHQFSKIFLDELITVIPN
ncbi:NUDIX domain-containing protein [Methylophaga sp.]|uniref:NUDIX domain-containing protein n=1 Tax=Methylophaga sp. TaxID=2024840 RepID=UPI003A8E38BD